MTSKTASKCVKVCLNFTLHYTMITGKRKTRDEKWIAHIDAPIGLLPNCRSTCTVTSSNYSCERQYR